MIKVLSAPQIRQADAYTIRHEPIASVDLMERAAKQFCKQFEKDHPQKKRPVLIFCGPGNNGGDGLAIARLLHAEKYKVNAFYLASENLSRDLMANLDRFKKAWQLDSAADIPPIPADAVVIDALFGSGLNRPLSGLAKTVVQRINSSGAHIVSVDIPSGSYADEATNSLAVNADQTYTFQFPKRSFFFPKQAAPVEAFTVLDIGLHRDYIDKVKSDWFYTESADITSRIKPRPRFSHKGSYGHALIVAGSKGKMGAAVLACRAAARAGCGLVTAHIPAGGLNIVQTAFPEAMCSTDLNDTHITQFPNIKDYDAIAIGPGIGTHKETGQAFAYFVETAAKPLIIDADGLNILAANPQLLKKLPAGSILTPHPKEFERLAGKWKSDAEKFKLLQQFTKKYKLVTVLKGASTAICHEGIIYFNPTGNAGMATGGSGDTLTGILCGMLAQGYSPFDAALCGVYLHGLAADLALEEQSMESLVASDIAKSLGKAFGELKNKK